jgi:hypothetical protein
MNNAKAGIRMAEVYEIQYPAIHCNGINKYTDLECVYLIVRTVYQREMPQVGDSQGVNTLKMDRGRPETQILVPL